MDVDDAIRQRRSVRGFLPHEVPDAVLREVFELAQFAPSGCNVQPWIPHVVRGASLARLRAALLQVGAARVPPSPDWRFEKYTGEYRDRQYDAAARLYNAMGIERADLAGREAAALRNLEFFGAPHAVFIFMHPPLDTREAGDVGMYAQTLMLAMTGRGISSCPQGALGLYPDVVRAHLGLREDLRLLFGISFGYEDPDSSANRTRVGRVPLSEAVRFHHD